jgi:hypothetical protein
MFTLVDCGISSTNDPRLHKCLFSCKGPTLKDDLDQNYEHLNLGDS